MVHQTPLFLYFFLKQKQECSSTLALSLYSCVVKYNNGVENRTTYKTPSPQILNQYILDFDNYL